MSVSAARIDAVLDAVPKGLFIGGEWLETSGGVKVEDPSTGEVIAEVADASPEQGIEALDAAVAAAESTGRRPIHASAARSCARPSNCSPSAAEDIALLMTLEMGKPLAEARGEVTYGAEFFRWFSEEAVRIAGRYSVAPSGGTRLLTMKQPVGPVTRSPHGTSRWPWAPARSVRRIAAGCTVVIKPAAQTPLTTLALAAVLIEAGCPTA